MSEVVHFRCDRCGAVSQDPTQTMRVVLRPSEVFSLDQEEVDLCIDCEKLFMGWLKQEDKR